MQQSENHNSRVRATCSRVRITCSQPGRSDAGRQYPAGCYTCLTWKLGHDAGSNPPAGAVVCCTCTCPQRADTATQDAGNNGGDRASRDPRINSKLGRQIKPSYADRAAADAPHTAHGTHNTRWYHLTADAHNKDLGNKEEKARHSKIL
jgi:hypothetical protein